MDKYYIAYGSNLNIEQMNYRCPGARVVGTGVILGYTLLFKGSLSGSYLTIEKCEHGQVPVAVWKVNEEHEKALDRYEGYPNFYYKTEMEIDIVGIKTKKKYHKKAFVYIMHENRKVGVPSNYYFDVCADGYTTFGFDFKYLEQAYKKSFEEVRNGNKGN